MHEKANYALNVKNLQIQNKNKRKMDFLIEYVNKLSNGCDIEGLMKKFISTPIPPNEDILHKLDSLKIIF